jgi:secondary thiamine-phosphate synthase enzyme
MSRVRSTTSRTPLASAKFDMLVTAVLTVATAGECFVDITDDCRSFLDEAGAGSGMLTLFCRHTSASLLIQENADPDVLSDLKEFFRRVIPEDSPWIVHRTEGLDDMPAHIKTALTQTSLAVPVSEGQLLLGTWQGLFLFEHRSAPHRRQVAMHLIGE